MSRTRKLTVRLMSFFTVMLAAQAAFAQSAAANDNDVKFALALAAGLGIAIAAAGGAIGQGRVAAAALEGIARNPEAQGQIFTPMLLGLAFVESLVLFTFVICFLLQNRL